MIDLQVKLDTRPFEQALARVAGMLGKSLPAVYRDQLGLLMRNLIQVRTPPRTRAQGVGAVRRDLVRYFVPVSDDFIPVLLRIGGAEAYAGTYRASTGISHPIAWGRILTDAAAMERYHHARRHPRTGRPQGSDARPAPGLYHPDKAFVAKSLYRAYERSAITGVGAAKSGWWPAARHVYTQRAPASWITGKANRFGSAIVDLRPGPKQSFVAINRSPWTRRGDSRRVVGDALRHRQRQMLIAAERELARSTRAAGLLLR